MSETLSTWCSDSRDNGMREAFQRNPDPVANTRKPLLVMPANNTSWIVHYWSGLYGNVGHLYGPARRTPPFPTLPYVLDNGAFGAFQSGKPWDEAAFVAHVEYYAHHSLRPRWVVVPDVVANAINTISKWRHWAPILSNDFNLKLALAVQDGMVPDDIHGLKIQPDVIFVGGSTEWKWQTVGQWCANFPRVHVGRVNTRKYLEICQAAGAESCDGTGWFRGRSAQIAELGHFLARQAGKSEADVDRIVFHSRLKNMRDPVLPLEEAA